MAKPAITPAVRSAVNAYLMARTHAEVTRGKIDKMEREVLAATEYHVSPEWEEKGMQNVPERVTDPKITYLMTEEDFARYHAECQRRIRAMGYTVPDGYCPALMAENVQIKAERVLIEAGAEMIGDTTEDFADRLLCLGMAKYHEFTDLLVRLVVSRPGYRNPLTGALVA